MNVKELIEKLQELDPDLPVFVCSEYQETSFPDPHITVECTTISDDGGDCFAVETRYSFVDNEAEGNLRCVVIS